MDSFALQNYVAAYVREILCDEDRKEKMMKALKNGRPFVTSELLCVAMIDISGYSTLFSKLAELGKISSEIVTESVGKYMDQIIDVIYQHQGDIVKFLGDAVLVTFALKDESESEVTLAVRAFDCCCEILSGLGSFQVALSGIYSGLQVSSELLAKSSEQIDVLASGQSEASQTQNMARLRLHGALAIGVVDRVIIGSEDRMDYSIYSSSLSNLGAALDQTSPGELGLCSRIAHLLGVSATASTLRKKTIKDSPNICVVEPHLSSLKSSVPTRTSSINSKKSSALLQVSQKVPEASFPVLCKFLNKSLLKLHLRAANRHISIKRNSSTLKGDHFGPYDKQLQKRVNEFRDVSIVFIKLLFDGNDKVEAAQKTMLAFLQAVEAESGVFQQYSVDDKGQTMLAAFGLPPWPNENTAVAATRAMTHFLNYERSRISLKISVTSGQILFSEIGNEFRKDASLLGDIVNVAARMLSLKDTENSIVCDEATTSAAKSVMKFQSFGDFMFKGRTSYTPVWKLDTSSSLKPSSSQQLRQSIEVIGYSKEQRILKEAISTFLDTAFVNCGVLIQGSSGMGKSNLLRYFLSSCLEAQMTFSLSQGSEVDQWTPYFGVRSLFSLILQSYISSHDSARLSKSLLNASMAASLDAVSPTKAIRQSTSVYGSIQRKVEKPTFSKDQQLAQSFLQHYGEPSRFSPLLKLLTPTLRIPETEWSLNLDANTKSSLVRAMFIRIFNFWSSGDDKNAVVFDDAQWIDPASLEILHDMIEQCPKLLVLICSRPITEAMPSALQKISKTSQCKGVFLDGFTPSEVNEFMVTKLKNHNVLNIDEEVLIEIYKRTKGSPLFADHIAISLRENLGVAFDVDASGTLFAKKSVRIESVLLSGIDAGVKSQFDSDVDGNVEELQSFIETADTYKYLTFSPKAANAKGDDLDEESIHTRTLCSFRHITIVTTIYEGMPFSRRVELHTMIAEMFETIAARENRRKELLPLMGFHFARSDRISKKIDVLEELAVYYLESCDYMSCHGSLESLIAFVDENHELVSKSLSITEAREVFAGKRRALWLSLISESYALRTVFHSARINALAALKILGIPDIEDHKKLNAALKKALLRQIYLLIKTKRGLKLLRTARYGRNGDITLDPAVQTLDEKIRYHAFNSLVLVSLYDDTVSKTVTAWSIFELANAIIPTADARPVVWGRMCARGALALHLNLRSLSRIYFKTLNQVILRIGDQADSFRHVEALILMMYGKMDAAVRSCQMYTDFYVRNGDKYQAFAGVCFTAEASFTKGDVESAYRLVLPYIETAPLINPYWSALVPKILSIHSTYKGDLDEAKRYIELSLKYARSGPNIISVRELPNGFKAVLHVLRDDPSEEILESLRLVSGAMRDYQKASLGVFNTIFEGCFACCLVFMDLHGASRYSRFTTKEKERFMDSVKNFEVVTHYLGILGDFGFMNVAWKLIQLAKELARANGDSQKLKWWKKLVKSLEQDSKTKIFLQVLPPFRSYILLAVSAFGPTSAVQKFYFNACIHLQRGLGADGIARILESSPMYMQCM
ncbi:hypothetical protein HDU97_002235 [Phlyctochytrium planicorne]|nr:hypothetical protein HDU97_002235 [Phlyctochytrium planicorne]